MDNLKRNLLILITLRLLLVNLALGAAAFLTTQQPLLTRYLAPFALLVWILSVVYLALWKYGDRPGQLYNLQFYFDLVLISVLIYFSGGINSVFSPFYLLIIVYASLLRHQKGGILALALSTVSYLAIVHLHYLESLSGAGLIEPYRPVLYRVSLNMLAFAAVAILGIYLSERLQTARQELGAAKVLHQHIVDSIRTGILTLDQKGRITSLNQTAQVICGHRQQEVLLRPLSKIFPQFILETLLTSDLQATSRALRMESWIHNGKNQSLFLGMSFSPLLSQNEKLGYIVSFQDLTEIRKREEEVQLKEKMAAIGQISADLAHEIRNPLGSLSGSIQILKSELKLSQEKRRLIEIVLRECHRLNNIIAHFLDYAGPQTSRLQPVDLFPSGPGYC